MKINSEEVAKQLKVSNQYARKLMREGKIKSVIEGKTRFTTQENINEFLASGEFVVDPKDRIRKSNDIPNIVALSFFSGAMGLDIGMMNAGITPVLACENDKNARATIVANNNEIGLIGDIWEFNEIEIRKYANLPEDLKVDVIFGGPPCQAFSTAGNRKGFEDARGDVFIRYLDIIDMFKPTYAVIENVRGLITTEAILESTDGTPVKGAALHYTIERLESLGYTISFELYNAANFGTPQKRERLVLIAKMGNEKVPYLTPTHSENGEFNLPLWKTLKDAIGDIQDKGMTYSEIPKTRIDWFKKIPEGGNWKSLTEEEQKQAMGKKFYMGGGKTGFFRRLAFNQPSPTLVTVPTMPATDLIHPTELRPLSVEEYARIQGFPDSWKFYGNTAEKYKQIGNAVPIKLGEAIGKTIINDMNGINDNNFIGFKYSRYKNTCDKKFPELYEKNLKKAFANNNIEQLELSL